MHLQLPKDAATWLTERIDKHIAFLRTQKNLPDVEQKTATRLTNALITGKTFVYEVPNARPLPRPYDVSVRDALLEAVKATSETELRWLLIAWELMGGAHDFCSDELEVLVAENIANVAWSVAAASWVRSWSGQDTTPYLQESLHRLETRIADFRSKVVVLSNDPDHFLRTMSRAALEVLDGGNLPDNIG